MHEPVRRVPRVLDERSPQSEPVSVMRPVSASERVAYQLGSQASVRSAATGRIQRREQQTSTAAANSPSATGLDPAMIAGARSEAGVDLSNVTVHHHSSEPAVLGAHAFTRGNEIHIGPGQQGHLAHEAWHVVQQRRGQVAATAVSAHGLLNQNAALERDADKGGIRLQARARALTNSGIVEEIQRPPAPAPSGPDADAVTQFVKVFGKVVGTMGPPRMLWDSDWGDDEKAAAFENLSAAACALIVSKTTQAAKDFTQWVEAGRPENDPEDKIPDPEEPLSDVDAQWYAKLQSKGLDAKPVTPVPKVSPVRQEIPKMKVPNSNTGGQAPHKKTPAGHTGQLQVNYSISSTGNRIGEQMPHMMFFAKVAKELKLKLRVVARQDAWDDLNSMKVFNGVDVVPVVANYDTSEWAEDANEYLEPHTRATLATFTRALLSSGIARGREARWLQLDIPGNVTNAMDATGKIPVGTLVNDAADAGGMEPTGDRPSIRSYIEGGNMLSGEDANGDPLVLIGKDAFAATAFAYGISEAEVHLLIAEDFGLKPSSILPVEQPGSFHLDMGMLFVGDGVVIVNDSRSLVKAVTETTSAATSSEARALPEVSQMEAVCRLEDAATKQLTEAGLIVRREFLAGDGFNFLNGEFVQTPDGTRHYLTNGSKNDERVANFRRLMVEEMKVVSEVWFSPAVAAVNSLKDKGGVGCRMKGMPAGYWNHGTDK